MSEPASIPTEEHPGIGEQIFAEPWHAQLFAITVKLSEAKHFSWTEWTERFSSIQMAAATDGVLNDGSDYYDSWLAALESLLIEHGLADNDTLARLKEAWTEAYLVTPHGEPVELKS